MHIWALWLQVMFEHREEREELLAALVVDDKDFTAAHYPQVFFIYITNNLIML